MNLLIAAVSLFSFFSAVTSNAVVLERLSQTYLPFQFTKDGAPQYCLGEAAAEQLSYDISSRVLYVSGNQLLRVIDITDPVRPTVLTTIDVPGEITDVAYCGEYVAASVPGDPESRPGRVYLYAKYSTEDGLELLHSVKVGALPDSIAFTPDCAKLVVGNEGEAGVTKKGKFVNPQGTITVINITAMDEGGAPTTENFDIKYVNEEAEEAMEDGVRWVWRGQGLKKRLRKGQTLSRDLEPEQVVISEDGKRAFINLQENNALAIFDLEKKKFISLTGYGEKDLSLKANALDTSSMDGIGNLRTWDGIYALYQPDVIAVFNHEGEDYIVIANEGDTKEYNEEDQGIGEWLEFNEGSALVNRTEGIPKKTVNGLKDPNKLGELVFSKVDGVAGKNDEGEDVFSKLVTYGGRSWSIFRAADMSRVYDSGNDFETVIAAYLPWASNPSGADYFCLTGSPEAEPNLDHELMESLLEVETLIDPERLDNMIESAKKTIERLDALALSPEPETEELEYPSKALTTTPNDTVDGRSTSKGPEPEALVIGSINDRRIVIVSVERGGAIFVYDVTDPLKPIWQSVIYPGAHGKTWAELYNNKELIDIDPEGMVFVSKEDSPNGEPLLLVSGAVSGTVSIYAIRISTANPDCENAALVQDNGSSTTVISTQTLGC